MKQIIETLEDTKGKMVEKFFGKYIFLQYLKWGRSTAKLCAERRSGSCDENKANKRSEKKSVEDTN